MHDITDLEGRGIPGVFIATTEFVDAAVRQSEALGVQSQGIFVAHPIQDRTADEVAALAENAAEEILRRLCEAAT